eukprot:CAMPEP_0198108456 /NCGR_PEP_ID=MMETSP1442-20131203/498_1 /TAXON_ID= /ORGANISM="Craspedostauros australis, Strain CCMP3328" /LENGTH=286 /DNA_ID=CAMNT_0043763725 /DNA_START=80 /DNA_END=940 /DNA_ORIENTATION=-
MNSSRFEASMSPNALATNEINAGDLQKSLDLSPVPCVRRCSWSTESCSWMSSQHDAGNDDSNDQAHSSTQMPCHEASGNVSGLHDEPPKPWPVAPLQASSLVPPQKSKTVKRVRFSTIEIREYPMTLGGGPTSCGAPVTLEWRHVRTTRKSLLSVEGSEAQDRWEESDGSRRSVASLDRACSDLTHSRSHLVPMPSWMRRNILEDAGFSQSQIVQAKLKSKMCQQQRRETDLLDQLAKAKAVQRTHQRKKKSKQRQQRQHEQCQPSNTATMHQGKAQRHSALSRWL